MSLLSIVVKETFEFINKATGVTLVETVDVTRPMCIHEGNVHYVKQGGVGALFCKATPALIALAKATK